MSMVPNEISEFKHETSASHQLIQKLKSFLGRDGDLYVSGYKQVVWATKVQPQESWRVIYFLIYDASREKRISNIMLRLCKAQLCAAGAGKDKPKKSGRDSDSQTLAKWLQFCFANWEIIGCISFKMNRFYQRCIHHWCELQISPLSLTICCKNAKFFCICTTSCRQIEAGPAHVLSQWDTHQLPAGSHAAVLL